MKACPGPAYVCARKWISMALNGKYRYAGRCSSHFHFLVYFLNIFVWEFAFVVNIRVEVHRLSADNRYRPFDKLSSADYRHRPIIGRLFTLLLIYDTQIKIDTHTFWFECMGKCVSVVRRQDSGTVRAGPNRILEFPRSRKLFILHRPLNTAMGWAGPYLKTTN